MRIVLRGGGSGLCGRGVHCDGVRLPRPSTAAGDTASSPASSPSRARRSSALTSATALNRGRPRMCGERQALPPALKKRRKRGEVPRASIGRIPFPRFTVADRGQAPTIPVVEHPSVEKPPRVFRHDTLPSSGSITQRPAMDPGSSAGGPSRAGLLADMEAHLSNPARRGPPRDRSENEFGTVLDTLEA